MNIRYFDNSATTRIKPEVLKEMFLYINSEYGNPSSIYTLGRYAKKAIENARMKVANLINCNPEEIFFTSCGTESDNTALKGIAYANRSKGKHIITSKIEHHAILNTCKELEKEGFEITYLDVNSDGIIKIDELKRAIREDTILISLMFANNEIGTIEPIEEISEIAHRSNIVFHTDAVQAIGNIEIDVKKMNIDSLSLSGHKIYAPKGIGALYVKKRIEFEGLLKGGHQEKDKRAGTENVAGIIALGKACEIAKKNLYNYQNKLLGLRNYCLEQLHKNFRNIQINGSLANRLPGNINVTFIAKDATEIMYRLDEMGICVSGGSACSSSDSKPSHVLKAIGLSEEKAQATIRITFGDFNLKSDVDYLIKVLKMILSK